MDESHPEWLTPSYMEQTLRTYYNEPALHLVGCVFHMALGKGENFGGILIKATVEYETGSMIQRKSYIIKTSFENDEFAKKKMAPYDIYNREMCIYEHVLPKLTVLMREAHIEDELFAKVLRVDYERSALVFEDLSARGYTMADRKQGLDRQHAKMILRKLAIMHACTAVLNERKKCALERYDRGFFNRHTDAYSSYFLSNLEACSRLVSQWPQFENYAQKLRDLKPYYMEIGRRCFEIIHNQINVLSHGDLWTNNVMFKYDAISGRPLDAVLIDFQYSFWGSPTLDLHYFFNTSLREDMRLHRQDELWQYYYHTFTETLGRLKYQSKPLPSLHRFRLQAEQKRFYAFHSACIIQPVMLNSETTDADFNALMNEDERSIQFKDTVYKNKIVQQNLKVLLPMFERRGLLDTHQCD